MAIHVDMPKLSDTMTEGVLVKWLKKQGDRVEIGDVIAEIETDKATMEMEAFDEGILAEIFVQEGEKVPVGGRMALLLDEGEAAPAEAAAPAPQSETDAAQAASGDGRPTAKEPVASTSSAASRAGSGRIKASPLARKIAAERGIDLSTVQGTGPGGRILRRDLLQGIGRVIPQAAETHPNAPPSAQPAAQPAAAPQLIRPQAGEGDQRIPLSGMRRIIAERLLASKTQIPHFYLHIEVDAAPLMALRQQLNAGNENKPEANNYTINDFILRAVVQGCGAVPEVNASFDGDALVRFQAVNLSVAIALDEGLVTPVIRNAQEKSLLQLSLAVKDLAARARSKKLSPDEFQGGTVTVTNLGAYGIRSFDAIINPPQCAIVAVGAISALPVVAGDGSIVAGQRMDLGLSGDHRVIDGVIGARYLTELKRLLEHPALMLL